MSHADRCPVCFGKGVVPMGFYDMTNDGYSTTAKMPEPCKSCGGSGYIIIPDTDILINSLGEKMNKSTEGKKNYLLNKGQIWNY